MRVVQLDFADRSFPASMHDVDVPSLPRSDWARIEVAAGGICGSDLHFFNGATGPAESLSGYGTLQMDLGHEIAGLVVEAGPDCEVAVGTAVAVDPVIACVARGIDPPCRPCAEGRASTCHNFGSRVLTPGMGLGFTSGLGSGWAEQVVAHRSMLHALPAAVPVDTASLHEPLSIAVHGLLRQPPQDRDAVLIVGAGIIGLCAISAVAALFPASPITVLAKYEHQAETARRIGATNVVLYDERGAHFDALAELSGTVVRGGGAGRMLAAGFPYVIEAVGTEAAVTEALRFADGRATVLVLGAAGRSNVDLSPVWFKELAVVGSFCHAADGGSHSIDIALDLLASNALPADLVITHTFPLDAWRDAISVALDRKGSQAIKVVLTP